MRSALKVMGSKARIYAKPGGLETRPYGENPLSRARERVRSDEVETLGFAGGEGNGSEQIIQQPPDNVCRHSCESRNPCNGLKSKNGCRGHFWYSGAVDSGLRRNDEEMPGEFLYMVVDRRRGFLTRSACLDNVFGSKSLSTERPK